MKEYLFESERKVYKLTEDGNFYSKFKDKPYSRFKLMRNYTQVSIGGGLFCKKRFFFEAFNGCTLNENVKVNFKNGVRDYSRGNLTTETVDPKTYPKYFINNGDRTIYHYNFKNELIGEYSSQKECERVTGIYQTTLSSMLVGRSRDRRVKSDASYFTYNKDDIRGRYTGYNFIPSGGSSIIQLTEDGEVVNKWDTINRAVEILGYGKFASSDIQKCCSRKRKLARGFRWKYGNDSRKKEDKLICYYEGDVLKDVYNTRKKLTESTGIGRCTISSVLSKRYTPIGYSIKEVSYNTGVVLRKQLKKEMV